MLQTKISVVVPVYNAGAYLKPCIKSILSQTLKEFELILVDDGSTDGSGALCDGYEKEDPRIHVVHKDNEGANATRFRGVQEAAAEWVMFCDADDTLSHDALERLYALHEGTDLVVGFINHAQELHPYEGHLDACRRALILGQMPCSPCAKLYRKALLTRDVFDFTNEIYHGEDMIMNTRILFKTTRLPRFLHHPIYNYRNNSASISHTRNITLLHETIFHQTLCDSIPSDVRPLYIKEITFSRLNGLFSIACTEPRSLTNKSQPYLRQIKEDAKACSYRLSPKEWILLHATSSTVINLIGKLELRRRAGSFWLRFMR